jgi:hypothetical protein
MSVEMRSRLSDDLPFWACDDEPFNRPAARTPFWYCCWAGAEKPWLEATIDADDSGLSLIIGTAV